MKFTIAATRFGVRPRNFLEGLKWAHSMRKYFVGVIFILLAAIVVFGYQSPTLGSLPQRISDAEYWKMIEDFSEPGGTFISPNYVSNELTFQQVIPDLQKTVKSGGVYLGVAPEQN